MSETIAALRRARRAEAALITLAVLASVAAAKLAQDFVLPVVLGIFGAYALRPIVNALRSLRIPEGAAAVLVIVALVGLLAGGVYALRDQATSALADLPSAAHTLRVRLRELASSGGRSPIVHVKEAAAELKKAATEVSGEPAPATPPPTAGPDLVDRLATNGINALGVLSTIGVALTITLFLLASGDTFRRKLLHVAAHSLAERRITVQILDEIDHQIQRYLLVMTVTNVALGFALWGAFAALGVERPALWAAISAVLHFIPYVGIVFVLAVMGTVAMLQFGTLAMVAAVLGATAVLAAIIGLFLQNWLQGRASNMNPVAVFVAVLFFGWLWGGWGLLLGAPLIAIVRSIASRIQALEPLHEFLSDGSRPGRPVAPDLATPARRQATTA
ncbi:MAG: AI-2E family transporter [Proteobacteria bacterium]|nr:AI-2E family transporter [Pseudomonadota bacterium]